MNILVTGSSGLIGSAAVEFFYNLNCNVTGIDNNSRAKFFGPEGSVDWNTRRLLDEFKGFSHLNLDICNKEGIDYLFAKNRFDVIIHAAAQPAHDYSFKHPYHDFQVNTVGTVNLLEATRLYQPKAIFIFTSTSKVYGTAVNEYSFTELDTRYDYLYPIANPGINETCRIDQDMIHSLFGASKAAADILVQEYGNYFGLNTVVLRPGCLTGESHSAVELHGFLSYLVKCVIEGKEYKIFDENGKRVRDNIDSFDVVSIMEEIINKPPKPGTVFNIGGCRENSISIIEALELASNKLQKEYSCSFHEPRIGDHIVYITDMSKFKSYYKGWKMKYSLDNIFDKIIEGYNDR